MTEALPRITELPPARGTCIRKPDKTGYDCPLGSLPGVTTVLGKTDPNKHRLEQWLARPGSEDLSRMARNRGTWVHGCIENWILAHAEGARDTDLPNPTHFAFQGYWRNIRPWLHQHWDQMVAIERPCFHVSGFAGSFDALGYVAYGNAPDQLTLLDWKTSRSKRDDHLINNYKLQLSAYREAIHYVYGIKPERALLVIARPTGTTPDLWEFDTHQLDDAYAEFQERLTAFYALPA